MGKSNYVKYSTAVLDSLSALSKLSAEPLSYDELMDAQTKLIFKDALSKRPFFALTSRRPTPIITDDIELDKEPIMKPLFQFATVAPSAEVIWNTLSDHDITAVAGYTVDEIRFYMFIVLQLRTDFKSAKELCNNYASRVNELHVATRDLLDLPTAQSSTSLRVPPADLPQRVHPELYVPYYTLKQLGDINAGLWNTLFNRTGNYKREEAAHLVADLKPISESITAYKLWYYGKDILTKKYSDIFKIDNELDPKLVVTKVEVLININASIYDYLEESDSHIFDYSNKIVIRPFILGVPDAPQ